MTEDNELELRPVTPSNWEVFTSIALSTPIVTPGAHPSDDDTIWGLPINHIGMSGIGKSQRLKTLVKAMGLPGVHVVFASTKQPSSFEGAPVPTPDGIVVECILPAARRCIADGGGCIFFDEVNGASPRTQNALLSSINDRQFGDHIVPPATRMMCAMNPQEHSAGGFTLSAPMANRLGHIWYEPPTKDDWGRYMRGETSFVSSLKEAEGIVKLRWNTSWRETNALLQGFIKRVGVDTFVSQPEDDHPSSSGAWPSYRTWHYAMCGIATCKALGYMEEHQFDMVHAFCGAAAVTAWSAWIADADLPTPEEMLKGGWSPDTGRVDKGYAALTNMTQFLDDLVKEGKREKALGYAEEAWHVLGRVLDSSLADLAAEGAKSMHKSNLGRHKTEDNAAIAVAAAPVLHSLSKQGYTGLV